MIRPPTVRLNCPGRRGRGRLRLRQSVQTPISAPFQKRNESMNQSNFAKPYGVLVFRNLADALRNGFQPFEKNRDGYLVRICTDAGWAVALARTSDEGNRSR